MGSILTQMGVTLAPTVGPVVRGGLSFQAAVERLAEMGFDAVQLDGMLRGLRPRELDRGARRDLAAMLARRGVRAGGIDLFIPRWHFTDAAEADRAVAATLACIELAGDLGRVPVCLALPVHELDAEHEVTRAIAEAADGRGVALAVHAEDRLVELAAWVDAVGVPGVGAGLDPAAVLAAGGDPVAAAHALGERLLVPRLSDAVRDADDRDATLRGERRAVGEGGLDVLGYRVAVSLSGRVRSMVLDLRGLDDPLAGARDGGRGE